MSADSLPPGVPEKPRKGYRITCAARPTSPRWLSRMKGYLDKKSGGKDGKMKMKLLEKWTRRFFVLPDGATVLSYYKDEAAFMKQATALGTIDCRGSRFFLKEVVKDSIFRFTVVAASRELKLRADTAAGSG